MPDRHEKRASSGFAKRLHEVIAAHGSTSALAKAIERSEGAVRKWLRGESEPNVTDLRSLCERTSTSIEWLVAGRGRRQSAVALREVAPPYASRGSGLNYGLLEDVMHALDEELSREALQVSSLKRATMVATLYELCRESRSVDPEAVARLVGLAR